MLTRLFALVRRLPGVTLTLLAAGAVIMFVQPAGSVSGTAGAVNVTVTPTNGLVDGQTVSIHAEATSGDLFEIRAHECRAGVLISNTFDFSSDGQYCAANPLSGASDAETKVAIPAGSGGKGDLTFRVGQGTAQWTTYSPLDPPEGTVQSLTCDAGNPCVLVVQLQVTDNTVFYTAPLCFGSGCPPETPPPTAGGPGASASAGSGAPGTGSGAGAAGAAAAAPASKGSSALPTAPGATTTTKRPPAAAGANGTSDKKGPPTEAALGARPAALESPISGVSSHSWRVFWAGVVGLLCGARIVMVVARARRQMALPVPA